MLFTRSVFQGVLNLTDELFGLNQAGHLFSYPKTPINVALINGKKAPLPMHLQGPSLFTTNLDEGLKKFYISEKEYKAALSVFEQTLGRLAGFFPQTEIKVVFLPSPLSSYQMVSSKVSFRGYFQKKNLVETIVIKKRHIKICEAIQAISSAHNVSFLNTTKSLRRVASYEFIHGPIDWDHLNKRGHKALSTDIAQVFLQSGGGVRTDNCVY